MYKQAIDAATNIPIARIGDAAASGVVNKEAGKAKGYAAERAGVADVIAAPVLETIGILAIDGDAWD